ncbi:MAG: M15 family metallopeptidase [Betaproteobacteria bacterium]
MANPHARSADLALLHPAFRKAVQQVLAALASQKIPFELFEGYRTPERQADLYAQGRTAAGRIVTYAPPWRSYHQYGLGVDLVLKVDGQWSWDTSGAKAGWWKQMQAVGKEFGLVPLDFELPHMQLAGTSSNALSSGLYPGGGDDAWAENLDVAILGWKGDPPAPPRPPTAQRPPLA